MQVNSSEMILITEMNEYSKMLTDQEITINLSYNLDYKAEDGIGRRQIRIECQVCSILTDLVW
jgi:hypothetical protein